MFIFYNFHEKGKKIKEKWKKYDLVIISTLILYNNDYDTYIDMLLCIKSINN